MTKAEFIEQKRLTDPMWYAQHIESNANGEQAIEQQENKLLQREQGIDRRDAAILAKETVLEEKQENFKMKLCLLIMVL